MTHANRLTEDYVDYNELMEVCEQKADEAIQDWEIGTTTFVFDDDSKIKFEGPDYEVLI